MFEINDIVKELRELQKGGDNSEIVEAINHKCRKSDVDSEAGVKYDNEKPMWDILDWESVEQVVKVLTYGAAKYPSSDNWKKIKKHRYVAASFRHMVAYMKGERVDVESGLPTLAHAVANLLFIMYKDREGEKC